MLAYGMGMQGDAELSELMLRKIAEDINWERQIATFEESVGAANRKVARS